MSKTDTIVIRLAICFAVLAGAAVATSIVRDGQAAEKIGATQNSEEVQDLLFLAARHPVFVRLHIQNGGRSFRDAWNTFVDNEFQSNDANSDGQLSVDEIKQLREQSDYVVGNMLAEMFESSRSRTEEALLDRHTAAIRCVAFSPDGKTLASGSDDQTVKLWDLSNGRLKATLKGHEDSVRAVEFSPDGRTVASGSVDGTVKVWDAASFALLSTLEGHEDAVATLAYSPDGKTLASAGFDNVVKLWNVADNKVVATLEQHVAPVWAIAFSPDGKTLATGGEDKTLLIWNLKDRSPRAKFTSPIIWSLAFAPDSKTVATCGSDRDILLRNVADGKVIRTLTGHQGPVRSVAFSPDGKQLVSASWDKTLAIWDAAAGVRMRSIPGHIDYVHCARYSPDGAHIVSGGDDRSLRYWSADEGSEKPMLRVGTVGRPQLARLLMQKERGPFRIRTTTADNIISTATGQNASQGTATSQLLARLDDDRDGRVSPEELETAYDALRKLDWDDNEMIELEELFIIERTYRMNASGNRRRMRTYQPFIVLSRTGDGIEEAARAVLSQYDRSSQSASDELASALTLTANEIGLDANLCARFDADGDSQLDASELSQLLLELEPDFELSIRLGESSGTAPRIEVISSKPFEGKPSVTLSPELGVTLRVENVEVQLAINGADSTDIANVFSERFKQADRDNNDYLEATEVENDATFSRPFPTMDKDGDGKVYQKEAMAYFAPRIASANSRVIMSTFIEGRNLFDILDVNRDGRLSRREFVMSINRIKQWDTDGDGELNIDEIPESLRVEFSRASADLIGAARAAIPMNNAAMAAPSGVLSPAWFQKMDRNQDGDVSEREFLGPASAFEKIDTNHDKLISPEEAGPRRD